MENSDKPTLFKRIDNFMRGVANGMTFGMADSIAAGGNTVVERVTGERASIGTILDRNLATEQVKTAQAHQEGNEARVGEVAGEISLVGAYGVLRAPGMHRVLQSSAKYMDMVVSNFGRAIRTGSPRKIAESAAVTLTRVTNKLAMPQDAAVAASAAVAHVLAVDPEKQNHRNAEKAQIQLSTPKGASFN